MRPFPRANVGALDQWLRFSAGFVLIFLAAAGVLRPWAYLLAVVPLLTALARYCPLYHALGISTRKPRHRPS